MNHLALVTDEPLPRLDAEYIGEMTVFELVDLLETTGRRDTRIRGVLSGARTVIDQAVALANAGAFDAPAIAIASNEEIAEAVELEQPLLVKLRAGKRFGEEPAIVQLIDGLAFEAVTLRDDDRERDADSEARLADRLDRLRALACEVALQLEGKEPRQ